MHLHRTWCYGRPYSESEDVVVHRLGIPSALKLWPLCLCEFLLLLNCTCELHMRTGGNGLLACEKSRSSARTRACKWFRVFLGHTRVKLRSEFSGVGYYIFEPQGHKISDMHCTSYLLHAALQKEDFLTETVRDFMRGEWGAGVKNCCTAAKRS